jgi:hypothetical protein
VGRMVRLLVAAVRKAGAIPVLVLLAGCTIGHGDPYKAVVVRNESTRPVVISVMEVDGFVIRSIVQPESVGSALNRPTAPTGATVTLRDAGDCHVLFVGTEQPSGSTEIDVAADRTVLMKVFSGPANVTIHPLIATDLCP